MNLEDAQTVLASTEGTGHGTGTFITAYHWGVFSHTRPACAALDVEGSLLYALQGVELVKIICFMQVYFS